MDVRHLKCFVSVVEERNFNRAAASLRVSQPAVSHQISSLEEELGVTLFVRNGHGVELTSEGEIMLAHARAVLRRVSDAKEAMRVFQKRPNSEKLAIGYIAAEFGSALTLAFRRFEALFPTVEFNLFEMSPQDQVGALISRRLDMAFIGSPYRHLEERVSVQELQKQTIQVVVADHHPLALRKHVALEELSEEAFVGFCEETFPGRNDAIISTCGIAGFTPRIRYLANSPSAVIALVAIGKGVTLTTGETSRLPQSQTAFLKLKPAVPPQMLVVATRKDEDRLSIRKLIDLCKEQAERENTKNYMGPGVARPVGSRGTKDVARRKSSPTQL